MCTIAIAWLCFEDAPVVLGANREEAAHRPSSPPAIRWSDPRVCCPLDERAGGTWLGVNEHGVLVAVTNRRADLAGERSRGLLVRDALGRESAAAARSLALEEFERRTYAGCNLLVADDSDAWVLEWDGRLRETALDPGHHVLVNAGLDDGADRARAVREAIHADPPQDPVAWRDRVRGLLADHDIATCRHDPDFGTRSSSLVTIAADGGLDWRYADGRPCETDYAAVDVDW